VHSPWVAQGAARSTRLRQISRLQQDQGLAQAASGDTDFVEMLSDFTRQYQKTQKAGQEHLLLCIKT
jgi:hypothetical protein